MNRELVSKGVVRGLFGFALGVIVGLVFLWAGSDGGWGPLKIALHIILSGVQGMVAMGFTIAYEVESWSVTRCTVTHFIITFRTYFIIGFSLGWFPLDKAFTYILVGCMVVAYFMIWVIMYLISKKQTKELDDELKKWKQSKKE